MAAPLMAALVLVTAATAGQNPRSVDDALLAARAAGLVGERWDGYLGVRDARADAALLRSVQAANIKRRALYADLAMRRGVTPQDIAWLTACTLVARVAVGEAYRPDESGWLVRAAGQAAILPDHCKS